MSHADQPMSVEHAPALHCMSCTRAHACLQVPGLEPFRGSLEEIYANFNKYKRTVPVRCG